MVSVKCLNDSRDEDSLKRLTPQNCLKLEQSPYNRNKNYFFYKNVLYIRKYLSDIMVC